MIAINHAAIYTCILTCEPPSPLSDAFPVYELSSMNSLTLPSDLSHFPDFGCRYFYMVFCFWLPS
ncbi:hypothetical protein HanIR_Chr14g0718201 [Helianthus annuus]|nr:hypothetical protein HanIR_Chr14g0718201 [Helianthus annuus]